MLCFFLIKSENTYVTKYAKKCPQGRGPVGNSIKLVPADARVQVVGIIKGKNKKYI